MVRGRREQERRIAEGTLCSTCGTSMGSTPYGYARRCQLCLAQSGQVAVIAHIDEYDGWWCVQFLLADAVTSVGRMRRYRELSTVRAMLTRAAAHPNALCNLDRELAQWGRTSVHLVLTDEQIRRLR